MLPENAIPPTFAMLVSSFPNAPSKREGRKASVIESFSRERWESLCFRHYLYSIPHAALSMSTLQDVTFDKDTRSTAAVPLLTTAVYSTLGPRNALNVQGSPKGLDPTIPAPTSTIGRSLVRRRLCMYEQGKLLIRATFIACEAGRKIVLMGCVS